MNSFNEAVFLTMPTSNREPPMLSNGTVGMILLVGTETVLFSCFIGAYLVLRMSAAAWPPWGTPRLTMGLSTVNTGLLVLSSVLAVAYRRAMRAGRRVQVKAFLMATLGLGVTFLLLQGVEFHRLYARGLTLQTGPYGAVFFSLITCHALHVLGGLVFLSSLLVSLRSDFGPRASMLSSRVGYSEIYWHFVTAVWLILFAILYIF